MSNSPLTSDDSFVLAVTAPEMQAMDRQTIESFGIPGIVLMENAGRGATRFFMERVYATAPGKVALVAGRGNNGGDGFVMARYLAGMGIPVTVYLLAKCEGVRGDAAANLKLLEPLNVEVIEMPEAGDLDRHKSAMVHASCWIDAMFGTGLKSEVRGRFAQMLDFINSLGRPVFAVDIPSGINSDTGQVCGTAIRATATATFAFAKIGHLVTPGAEYTGHLRVIDIGIPRHVVSGVAPAQHVINGRLVRQLLPKRSLAAHKGTCGHVLVAAGARGKTGAAAMTSEGALRAGAGLVTLACPARVQPVLASKLTEVMTAAIGNNEPGSFDAGAAARILALSEGKTCLALGPGIGTDPGTVETVGRLITDCKIPMVIDADGLNCLAGGALSWQAKAPVILTPHPGEMARLTGQSTATIQSDRLGAARRLAHETRAVVILKGARTIVAAPDGKCGINLSGNPGMAAGGMGDVLTGLVAGFLAQGLAPFEAAQAAVWVHGAAADELARTRGPWGYTAGEVLGHVPQIISRLVEQPDPPAFEIEGIA